MRSSTCSGYKHLIFIPYALPNVVEDEGDFTVAEGHRHPREEKQNLFRPLADMNCFKSIAEFDQFVCESIRFSILSELDLQKTCFNSIEFVIKFKFAEENHPLSS
jgi:hypothetical protein